MAKVTRDVPIGFERETTGTAVMRFAGGKGGKGSWDPEKWTANIHEDKWVQQFGYKGGLVEAPPTTDHMSLLLIDMFGENFYNGGKLSLKLINPMYHGDKLRFILKVKDKVPEGKNLRIVMDAKIQKEDGTITGVGTASCLVD